MPFEIRCMTEKDLPAARALWAETEGVDVAEGDSEEDLARYLQRNPGMSTVGYFGDKLVAAVLAGHDGRRGFIYHLAVDQEHRGLGLGRTLMQYSVRALKAAGVPRVLLLVSSDNVAGRAFWLREGWETMPYAHPMGLDL